MLKIKIEIGGSPTESQRRKLEKAALLFQASVNSKAFKDAVLNHDYLEWSYTGKLWWKKWTSRKVKGFRECNKTAQEVYSHLMTGAEYLSPEKDREADIEVVVASGSRGVIGWTNPHTPIQWISSWFINSNAVLPSEIAGNLSHEWLHKLGYDHAFNYYDGREETVPYAIGNIISKLSEYIENGQKLDPNA